MRFFLCLALLAGCGGDDKTPPQPGPHLIFIDIDDHGLSALWDSNSPNMQKMAREGVLAYTRVDIPTHSNQSNITLLTGGWPEVTDVPHNSWLDRSAGFGQPFILTSSLSAGSYIFYDKNPLGSRVGSIYSAAHDAGMTSGFVGLIPPFEHGADVVHFTIYESQLLGLLTVTKDLAYTVFDKLHYPSDVYKTFLLDGPPQKNEPVNQFTLRDASIIFDKAAAGGPPPPQVMFVWDFIALDNDPTSTDGAAGPAVKSIVEDIDKGVGDLLASVNNAGYGDRTSFVITLDHGKVDSNNQVVFETQLANLITAQGAAHNVGMNDVKTLNEDGDVLVYAATAMAGTAAGTARQQEVAHALVDMIHAAAAGGQFMGLDPTRTVTWDGYAGTRRFWDIRSTGPNNPDIIMFPQPDWTLNDVAKNNTPGPIGRPNPYGRHGGFSEDELYVPAIFYGPAFKKGVLLPETIDHADVAPTAMAAAGIAGPSNAQTGPVASALKNDMTGAETLPFPSDPHTTRPTVLANTGFDGNAPHLMATAAQGVILIDAKGLYEDGLAPGPNLAALIHNGVHFTHFYHRFRDFPTTEYLMLTGTYPQGQGSNWIPFAEDDPAQVAPPGLGQFKMPPAPNFVSDMAGYNGWRSMDKYTDQSVFTAAKQIQGGFTTAMLGSPDFHLNHIDATDVDVPSGTIADYFGAHNNGFIVIATDDVEGTLGMVNQTLMTANVADKFVIAVTSRGGAPIDAQMADAHGPGSARHVPLVIAGPNVRSGVVVDASCSTADIAPTLLYALGATAKAPDLAFGVQLDGGSGKPLPTGDSVGRVLMSAFTK